MKITFLTLPPDEQRLYIEQAAIRRNVSPVVLEKDFWVCWMLGVLFGSEFGKRPAKSSVDSHATMGPGFPPPWET